MITSNERTTASLIHLSTLTQYFIPFGNYIFPIIIWSTKKNNSEFVDYNGKQVLNFQLSLFLYTLILGMIAIPIFIFTLFSHITLGQLSNCDDIVIDQFHSENITGIVVLAFLAVALFGFLKLIEFILIIYGGVKASNGEEYRYPLSIQFFKTNEKPIEPLQTEQSSTEK